MPGNHHCLKTSQATHFKLFNFDAGFHLATAPFQFRLSILGSANGEYSDFYPLMLTLALTDCLHLLATQSHYHHGLLVCPNVCPSTIYTLHHYCNHHLQVWGILFQADCQNCSS
jgi:hypothetical protein